MPLGDSPIRRPVPPPLANPPEKVVTTLLKSPIEILCETELEKFTDIDEDTRQKTEVNVKRMLHVYYGDSEDEADCFLRIPSPEILSTSYGTSDESTCSDLEGTDNEWKEATRGILQFVDSEVESAGTPEEQTNVVETYIQKLKRESSGIKLFVTLTTLKEAAVLKFRNWMSKGETSKV